MFQLPEDLTSLDRAALSALLETLRSEFKAALTAEPAEGETKPTVAELRSAYDAARGSVLALIALADEVDPEPVEEKVEEAKTDEVEAGDETKTDEVEDKVEDVKEEPAAGDAPVVPVITRTGLSTEPVKTEEESRKALEAKIFKAHPGASGKQAGEQFENWADVARTLMETAEATAGSGTKHVVGAAQGRFEPHMILGEQMHSNLKLFERDEITAALCAPLPTVYDLACMNSTRRPVKASLPVFRAPRGGVQIMSSPTLEDITTGFGIWDRFDDANPSAEKEECQTIQCNDPSEYYMYAVYRCMTVKNMLAMTYPELVEAWLNRLAARQARLAETQLLEAMATEVTTIQAHTLGYNATVSIVTNLLNYLVGYQNLQRWDVPDMEAWIPRWVLFAIKADMMRRRRTDGGFFSVPSDAQVNALFTGVGITPHWFIDTPSWATPQPNLQTSGMLGQFTRNLEILVAPRGKFAVIDRGELNFGVNNVMRDNTSLKKNEYTLFFENWEGIVNTTSCPAHILEFNNLCFNGQQIADVVINCEGYDQVSDAS